MCAETNRYLACCYSFAAATETDFGTLTCQPRHIWQLTRDVTSWGFCTDTSIGIATVVEYAVEQYGIETLPELLAGLGHYETWSELVPGVYGVSPDEFERGWQEYVAAHYQSHE
jgi:hypothetical protein